MYIHHLSGHICFDIYLLRTPPYYGFWVRKYEHPEFCFFLWLLCVTSKV